MVTTPPANFTPHTLLSFGGTIDAQPYQDIWQCGIRLMGPNYPVGGGGQPLNDPAGYLSALWPGLQSWFARAGTVASAVNSAVLLGGLSSMAYLTWAKCMTIDHLGHYAAAPVNGSTTVNEVTGSTQGHCANYAPPIITPAISWSTAKLKGKASHGRMFLPLAVDGTGHPYVTPGMQNAYLATAQALLHLLKNTSEAADAGATPVVCSRIDASVQPITGIRVGNVLDVQRRRKNAYAESYVSGPTT